MKDRQPPSGLRAPFDDASGRRPQVPSEQVRSANGRSPLHQPGESKPSDPNLQLPWEEDGFEMSIDNSRQPGRARRPSETYFEEGERGSGVHLFDYLRIVY